MNLNAVRELKEKIVTAEAELENLRGLAQNLVPTMDGTPTVRSLDSRVEKLALKIVAAEQKLDALKTELDRLSAELFDEIQRRVKSVQAATVVTLHFVTCLSFRQIARRISYSLRQVFRLNQQGVTEYENFKGEESSMTLPTIELKNQDAREAVLSASN